MYIDGKNPDYQFQKCKRKIVGRVLCEFHKLPEIHVKGLCEESQIDRNFQLIDPTSGERKYIFTVNMIFK